MLREPNCYQRQCKWFTGVRQPTGEESGGEILCCKAFPFGIPSEISYGEDLHNEVKPDQVGDYVYAKK